MTASHYSAMRCIEHSQTDRLPVPEVTRLLSTAARMMDSYRSGVAALLKLKTGGKQKMQGRALPLWYAIDVVREALFIFGTKTMRYTYISLHHLLGLTLPATGEEIFSNSERGIRAILTSDPAALCSHLDTAVVLPGMLLQAKVGNDAEMEKQLADEICRLRKERAKAYPSGTYLYFEASGDVPEFAPEVQRDCGGFIVALDSIPKTHVQNLHAPLAGRILAAIAIAMPTVTGHRKVAAVTVFMALARR